MRSTLIALVIAAGCVKPIPATFEPARNVPDASADVFVSKPDVFQATDTSPDALPDVFQAPDTSPDVDRTLRVSVVTSGEVWVSDSMDPNYPGQKINCGSIGVRIDTCSAVMRSQDGIGLWVYPAAGFRVVSVEGCDNSPAWPLCLTRVESSSVVVNVITERVP